MYSRHIRAQYFGFKPALGHMATCPNLRTDLWEVREIRSTSFADDRSEDIQVTRRFVCHACGVVHFEKAPRAESAETTDTAGIGYGLRPEKVKGLWLHPSAPVIPNDERGPSQFYVTATPERPTTPAEVLGIVGWHLTRRHAVRWSAGYLLTSDGYGVQESGGTDFKSRTAAVSWIGSRHLGRAAA